MNVGAVQADNNGTDVFSAAGWPSFAPPEPTEAPTLPPEPTQMPEPTQVPTAVPGNP